MKRGRVRVLKHMKKKIIISIIILLILVAGGGFWWWKATKIERIEKRVGFSLPMNYIVKETGEGKFIENEREGLRLKVPDGWEVIEREDGTISLLSPEFKEGENLAESYEKGCLIEFRISKLAKEESLKYEIERITNFSIELKKNPEKMKNLNGKSYEIVRINNYQGLKTIFIQKGEKRDRYLSNISVEIPREEGERIYFFETHFSTKNEEKCAREFNNFLETISIY